MKINSVGELERCFSHCLQTQGFLGFLREEDISQINKYTIFNFIRERHLPAVSSHIKMPFAAFLPLGTSISSGTAQLSTCNTALGTVLCFRTLKPAYSNDCQPKKYQHCFSLTIWVIIITTNGSKRSHWNHEHQTPNHLVIFYLILLPEFKLSCYSHPIINLDHVNT